MAGVQTVQANHLQRQTKEELPRLEEIKQLVSCLNCHRDPNTKLLNCNHALCNTCLLHFQQKGSIQCPVCLDMTPVPDKGVSMLENNSLGEDLYQITRCEIDFKNHVRCTTCFTTPSNEADYFCQPCRKYYCQMDFQTHQLQHPSPDGDKQHKIILRGDSLSVSICETTLDGLKQGIGEMQSKANTMNQFIQEIEFHKSNVEREEHDLQCEIRDKYQELREMINHREKYLLEILNSHYAGIHKELEKASEDMAKELLKLYHSINFVTKTVDLSSAEILSRIDKKLKEQIKFTLDSIGQDEITLPESEPLVFKVDDDVMNELVNFGTVGINRNYFTIDKPTMLFAKKGKHVVGGLAIDEENGIFVVDQENKKIDVFSTEGGFVRSFGQSGKKDGEFQKPHAICCRSNRVLVTDLVKCNVQVFSLSGKFLTKFGSKDTLKCPIGLDVWKDGYVFVVDQAKCWVVVHTPEFNFGWLLGEGKMTRPVDLKVAQWAEIFFILDDGSKSVIVFNRDGEVIRKFETETIQLKEPFCLALDSIGHVLVSDLQEQGLRVFNWAGRRSEGVCPSFGVPKGIAVDRKGRVVMAEDHEDKLQVLIF